VCKTFPPVYNSAKIIKIHQKIFQSYDHKCSATFLWFTVQIMLLGDLQSSLLFMSHCVKCMCHFSKERDDDNDDNECTLV